MRLKSLVSLIAIVLLASCKPDRSDRQWLAEKAYEKQTTAIALIAQLEERLESSAFHHRDSLLKAIETLKESLIEIPGHTLDLTRHEGHNHSHANIALSAEEIYNVQEDLLNQLNQIKIILDNS